MIPRDWSNNYVEEMPSDDQLSVPIIMSTQKISTNMSMFSSCLAQMVKYMARVVGYGEWRVLCYVG